MGLASAMSTALTGLTAAETTIDVVGNNLANSNTVGFKASEANFATQFLQTLSLGAQPTPGSGGTNPRQVGLGTMVADIAPNFNQGTIEISANPLDMAIQGEGFFIVQGNSGEQQFTRNGIFKLNADDELVSITGNRVLGFGVDSSFEIQRDLLQPIDLRQRSVAQATNNVFLEGTLSPTGDLADIAQRIQTEILGDGRETSPIVKLSNYPSNAPSIVPIITTGANTPGGGMTPGNYEYRVLFATGSYSGPPTPLPMFSEGSPSDPMTITVDGALLENSATLSNLPTVDPDGHMNYLRIFRRPVSVVPTAFEYVDQIQLGTTTTYTDVLADTALGPDLNETVLNGQYNYYITFEATDGTESRPSPISDSVVISGRRTILKDIPTGDPTEWSNRRIYRNLSNDDSTFHLVTEILGVTDPNVVLVDNLSDATISLNETINFDGPTADTDTPLTQLLRREGTNYEQVFEEGTLQFTGRKGNRSLSMKEFEIDSTTNVQNLIDFMEEALGIQLRDGSDPVHPIPLDSGSGESPGGQIEDGRIVLTGNNGMGNAIDIALSGMILVTDSGAQNVNLPFGVLQEAEGESAVTDFLAYDSLGIPIRVRLTAVLEARDSTTTTYRWFADSPDNDPTEGVDIAVGTGLITFDGVGNFIGSTESTVAIDRQHISSATPLEFDLDFAQISGLAADRSSLAVSRQDGSSKGDLISFIIGEDGTIRGVFSNGVSRDLGQLRLARFANPEGLEQRGENLFSEGVNSGLPVETDPGQQGAGTIIAGAVELSNTDMGTDLIELILASTMYRGNTRVITTAQQMIDELLALRR